MKEKSPAADTNMGVVTLHIPSRYGYLRVLRQTVMDACVRAGLSEFEAAQLEMAVDEACANIIEHGYGETPGMESNLPNDGIHVNLIQQNDGVVVEIYDRGRGFDIDSAPEVRPHDYLESDQERGLGLFIINRFVDELDYERGTPSGNCLRLTKRI